MPWIGSFLIEASVTVRGEPGAVLDADRRGPALLVDLDELEVVVEDLTVTGGAGEAGGGLRLSGWSEVRLLRVRVVGNEATVADGGVGGGIYAHRGLLRLVDCTVAENRARAASGIGLSGAARAEVVGGRIEGDVVVLDGAELTVVGGVVTGALRARGTTTRAPTVVLRGVAVEGGVENDANLPAALVVEDC